MTPIQKLRHMILATVARWQDKEPPAFTPEVDQLYAEADEDHLRDACNEIRASGIDTGLPCEWSSHYESKSVAAQAADGSWIGWTYWYGGGKHGNPSAIGWMEDSYDLNCAEEQKTVTVRTFTKAE